MNEEVKVQPTAILLMLLLIAITVFGGMWGCPKYNVWQQRLHGEAELARATFNRQIAVQEAEARMDAAVKLAAADTLRALGAARANIILGKSLQGNEAYLRYLWIQNLEHGGNAPTVIYVPTEAGLPILEAHRTPEAK